MVFAFIFSSKRLVCFFLKASVLLEQHCIMPLPVSLSQSRQKKILRCFPTMCGSKFSQIYEPPDTFTCNVGGEVCLDM